MSSKYSYMSNEEFLRFADGVVGNEVYAEALRRLEDCLALPKEMEELEKAHLRELDDLDEEHSSEIYRLECRIEALEAELEHA